tara:strand:+ start:4111 stop:4587 length:477 start_codon:yes stop_codon:yes gene_type:complete
VREPNFYLGLDPGKSGGLAIIWTSGKIEVMSMAETETGIRELFPKEEGGVAIIEKVHSMPKQGVASMFTFGRNYGFLRACLICLEIPFEEVTPQKWQKEFSFAKAKDKKTHKLNLLAKAQQLFPQLSLWKEPRTLGKQKTICDALLIAEYCKRLKCRK